MTICLNYLYGFFARATYVQYLQGNSLAFHSLITAPLVSCLFPQTLAAMGEAKEITAIRQNLSHITDVVTVGDNLQWFANKLVENAFISQQTSGRIIDMHGVTSADKANKILSSVFEKLRHSERKKHWFDSFVAIFSKDAAYAELFNKLRKSYEKS